MKRTQELSRIKARPLLRQCVPASASSPATAQRKQAVWRWCSTTSSLSASTRNRSSSETASTLGGLERRHLHGFLRGAAAIPPSPSLNRTIGSAPGSSSWSGQSPPVVSGKPREAHRAPRHCIVQKNLLLKSWRQRPVELLFSMHCQYRPDAETGCRCRPILILGRPAHMCRSSVLHQAGEMPRWREIGAAWPPVASRRRGFRAPAQPKRERRPQKADMSMFIGEARCATLAFTCPEIVRR